MLGAGEPTPEGPPELVAPDPERSNEAVVLSVQDGDSVTVLLDGELRRIELLGADAPEWLERAARQRPYAEEARRFLVNLLHGERVLVFEPEPGATDPLGRRRAYLFRLPDMAFVDLEIVRQGYGRVSTRADEPYADALRWYETRAKELERGLWGLPLEPENAPQPAVVSRPAAPVAAEPAPAKAPEKPAREQPAPPGNWVWVTRSGSKYHREDCSHLTASRTRVSRESVRNTHEPCRSCNPDT